MKNKLTKKDILSRVGSSLTHHSVYYWSSYSYPHYSIE